MSLKLLDHALEEFEAKNVRDSFDISVGSIRNHSSVLAAIKALQQR